jgi:hypothetical protein
VEVKEHNEREEKFKSKLVCVGFHIQGNNEKDKRRHFYYKCNMYIMNEMEKQDKELKIN